MIYNLAVHLEFKSAEVYSSSFVYDAFGAVESQTEVIRNSMISPPTETADVVITIATVSGLAIIVTGLTSASMTLAV